MAVFSDVWPAECAATRLVLVHVGQSGQPRPDDERRTAAPVEMITALAITDARAHWRSDLVVGCQTVAMTLESTRTMLTLRSWRGWYLLAARARAPPGGRRSPRCPGRRPPRRPTRRPRRRFPPTRAATGADRG